MPGVGDADRVAPLFFGLAADFLTAGAGVDFFAVTAGAVWSGAGEVVLANRVAGRDTFAALFWQGSGSSEQRIPACAAVDSSAATPIAKSSWNGRVRFTWASDRTLPVRE
jgi:hypothetical protein